MRRGGWRSAEDSMADRDDLHAWCYFCKALTAMAEPVSPVEARGEPPFLVSYRPGRCADCGAFVVRIGGGGGAGCCTGAEGKKQPSATDVDEPQLAMFELLAEAR